MGPGAGYEAGVVGEGRMRLGHEGLASVKLDFIL